MTCSLVTYTNGKIRDIQVVGTWYLVVYQILKVSNLSLNDCSRDAIVKFFGGEVT